MTKGSEVIRCDGLTMKYRDITAVDNVSFAVEQGEIFGMIGPNGAGKTSIVECLEGLRKWSEGKLDVLGINPSNRKELYKHVGAQLQEASFPDDIKVGELCRLFSSFYDAPTDYNALLERFDLTDKKNTFVKRLSGGQKQKVSIAAALIGDPEVIFLDELTTGLDPQSRISMWELIKDLREEGRTICMTTHFMDEAEYLCDRVCMLVNGKIAALGTVRELVAQANLNQVVSFSSRDSIGENLRNISGVTNIIQTGDVFQVSGEGANLQRDIVRYLTEHNIDFNDFSSAKPGLEEVFLKLTEGKEGTA